MDRLTNEKHINEGKGYYYIGSPSYDDIYEKLAQYEDLGVSPEDIKNNYYLPPCAIGDTMWCIKNQSGKMTAQSGIVNEMFYTTDMRLMIVVKYVGRGSYGDKIFSDRESCQKRADELNKEGKIC